MSSPAADIAANLVTAGLGTAGTSIFVGREPGLSTLTVTLIDNGGPAPNPRFARDFLDIQIIVKGAPNDYANAQAKAEDIKNHLLGSAAYTVGTKTYFAFNMRGDINFLGYNENNQPSFTLNFRILRDSGDVGNRISL